MSERWDITGVDQRILDQYRDSPNLLALLRALADVPNDELRAAFESLLTRLDIDASVGIQLDLIGAIIGRSRPTVLDPLLVQGEGFFEFREIADLNDADRGFDRLLGVGDDVFTFVGFSGVGQDVFRFDGLVDVGEDSFEFAGLDEFGDPDPGSERKGFGEIGDTAGGLFREIAGIIMPEPVARFGDGDDLRVGFGEIGDTIGGLLSSIEGFVLPAGALPDASNIRRGLGALTETIGGLLRSIDGIVVPSDAQREFEGAPFRGIEALPSMTDPDYRELLRATIFLNTSGASVPELEFYGQFVLGVTVTVVNGFTKIDLEFPRRLTIQEQAIIDATFLPAAGIRKRAVKYASGEGAFGFVGNDRNTGFSGFDGSGLDVFEFVGLDEGGLPEPSSVRKSFGAVGQGDGGLMRAVDGVVLPDGAELIPNLISDQFGKTQVGAGFARVA